MVVRKGFILFIGLLLFIFPWKVSAQPEIKTAPLPDWIAPVSMTNTTQSEVSGVRYHLTNTQINHTLGEKHFAYELIMEPLNQQGIQDVAELKFSFYPAYEQLVFHRIEVIRNGKPDDRLDLSKIKLFQSEEELSKKMYVEKWNALYILEDIRPNDLIRYHYSLIGHNPVFDRHDFGSMYINWGVPVERNFLRVITNEPIRYQFTQSDVPVKYVKSNGKHDYQLELINVPSGPNETQYPYWYEPYNVMQYSGVSSWKEVTDWAVKLYQLDQSLPLDIEQQIEQWKKEGDTLLAINKIVEFVQNDIRYFGIELGVNSHRPRTPLEILEKRYGDCKDKSVLISAMLSRLGVSAYPALVASQRGKSIDNDLPSPHSFNHVISYFDYDGKQYWIDGTASDQRGELKDKGFFNYQHALILKPGQSKLTKIDSVYKVNEVIKEKITEKYTITASENKATLDVRTELNGLKAEEFRRYFNSVTPQQVSSNLINHYSKFYSRISSNTPYEVKDSQASNELTIGESYTIDEVATLTSSRKIFRLYASNIFAYIYKPERITRETPLALYHPVDITHTIDTVIEGDVLWNEELTESSVKSHWFEMTKIPKKTELGFEVEFHYRSLADHVESTQVPEYLEAMNELDQAMSFSFWAKGNASEKDSKKNMKNLIKSLIKNK